jgi:hypothetical protein
MPQPSPPRKRRFIYPIWTPERLEISRHEFTRLIEGFRRDLNRVSHPLAGMSPRRRAMIEAAAHALVRGHPRPWIEPSNAMAGFWHGPGPLPTRWQAEGTARESKRLVPFMDAHMDLAPWSGGLFLGLRQAGALVIHGGYPRLQTGRPWLENDMEQIEFPGHLSPADQDGRRWLTRCHAWRVTPTDSLGADVLAGLLAGARRQERDDGTWLVVPRTESVRRLLDYWKVAVEKGTNSDQLCISPFWGAILSGYMPPASAASMLVRRAGACPLLACAIYQVVWGSNPKAGYIMPTRAGEIPYICSHATRVRRGWGRHFLLKTAALSGVAYVPPEMTALLEQWRARNSALPHDNHRLSR